MLLVLLAHGQSGRIWPNYEAGLTAALERRVNCCNDYVHVGNSAVRYPCFGSVESPFVFGLVVHGTGPKRRNI
ncbi:unannotated protein [freshwater metagenome]|uniref:Unannotated protein n=1 Tax=freshwater metagenome TaxID=449393 RepID=A0A6J7UU64_9ZZZZ